jgi:aspartate/methionine/tyrosine aminotransferase
MKIRPFQIERFYAEYEFTTPYLLSQSDCESLSIRDLLALEQGAEEQFHAHWLGYTESEGSTELRREITTLYQTVQPIDVLVFSGAEEGIFTFMNAVLEAGDHIIVHAPGYQSLQEVARAIGCEVSPWLTHDSDGWELDINWLSDNIRPTTRAIVVNCPHNPTGYLMSHEKQAQIIEIAREHGIILFSDEVYRGLEHSTETLPAACDLYENAVSLGVMSKTYGLPGLRIGWLATRRRELYAQMAAFKDYTTICNSAPSEFLSSVALRQRDTIAQRNLAIIRSNLALLDAFFARHMDWFDWQRPQASSTAFPRLKQAASADEFCREVVEKQGVLLLPSTKYDYGDQHFRIGYGRKNMPQSLEQFELYMNVNGK